MDWHDHFTELLFSELAESLTSTRHEGILSGFADGEDMGLLAKALVALVTDVVGELWATQVGDGVSPLRATDILESLGLSNQNAPFVRQLHRSIDSLRDTVIQGEGIEAIISRVRTRMARDSLPLFQFRRRGVWVIQYGRGEPTFLEGTLKGPGFIRYLLMHQGEDIHVTRMLADVAGDERLAQASHSGPAITAEEIDYYRRQTDELLADKEAAAKTGDQGQLRAVEDRIAQIAELLAPLLGLHRKTRIAGDDVARIRKAIARVIKTAVDKMADSDESLGSHFRNTIKTSTFMSYKPETWIDWELE